MQAHKSSYWLFPKINDWEAFTIRVELICQLILESVKGVHPKRHVVSVDEKTSIQALQRHEGIAPKSKGLIRRREVNYIRHGTTCLMAAIAVGEGNIVNSRLHPTRTEEDFLEFIKQTVSCLPAGDEVVFMADQLNTHLSQSLVKWIAEQIGCKDDLGKVKSKGILKDQKNRKAFLENPQHRIRFVFTPTHCSWLNPIENWFGKLQRHAITNGNFSSVNELVSKIEAYINYYNQCLVKPLNWKFKGFDKTKMIKNYKCSNT